MAGYRDTLNLPRTDFPMKADLTRREVERLEVWSRQGAYAALRRTRQGRPVWLLHDGPPYSNNHIHMGTAANKIWKDAAVRVHSMLGYDAPYVPGWDNHGMPIEVQVGRDLKIRDASADRVTLRRACREYAKKWVQIQREEFERLGCWGEWEHPYLTMDSGFEAAIVEAFAGLAAKGFVQRGQRSIHWCPTDRTALAEAEIEYQDDRSPSIHVSFPLRRDPDGRLAKHSGVAAVAWTTTPWTLPANLGLMVDPAATYVVVEANGGAWLVAEPRLQSVAEAAGWSAPMVREKVRGAELVGLIFEGPWGRDSRMVDGTPFVSMEDGTGIVHTAPGHGKEDFLVGQRNGLGVECPVDVAGRFTAGAEPFVGESVLTVNDSIIAWLREGGRLLAAGTITHPYPHCWRCRNPVIFRATDQWFMIIDHQGHRERALECIDREVRWDPPSSRNRIHDAVRLRPDWCLSRQRAWGVGIPAIYCESCDRPDLDQRVMARVAEVTRAEGSDAWYERPVEYFLPEGYQCRHCGGRGPFRKETDILDVWFDSGTTHRAVRATHPELDQTWKRLEREGGRVAYYEGPDQHRGWFNSSLMVGVGLTGKAPYTDVLTHGWVLDAQGRAMHKSLGNVVSPIDVVKKYGAEIVRWWALATDWRTDVRVGDEVLQRTAEAYRKVRNTFRFLIGNLHDFDPSQAVAFAERSRVDQTFSEFLAARLERIMGFYKDLQFHRAIDTFLDLCTVHLSSVYLDVTKDRLYTLAPDDRARRSAQTVMWEALEGLVLAVAPVLPFTAEEIWQHHPALRARAQSVHLPVWEAKSGVTATETTWGMLLELRETVNAAIEPLRAAKTIATTSQANVTVQARSDVSAHLDLFRSELEALLMVAQVELKLNEFDVDATVVPQPRFTANARPTDYVRCERCWRHVSDVGDSLCGRCSAVLSALKG